MEVNRTKYINAVVQVLVENNGNMSAHVIRMPIMSSGIEPCHHVADIVTDSWVGHMSADVSYNDHLSRSMTARAITLLEFNGQF